MIFLDREKGAEGLKDFKGLKAVEVSSLNSMDADPTLQRGKDNKKIKKGKAGGKRNGIGIQQRDV